MISRSFRECESPVVRPITKPIFDLGGHSIRRRVRSPCAAVFECNKWP